MDNAPIKRPKPPGLSILDEKWRKEAASKAIYLTEPEIQWLLMMIADDVRAAKKLDTSFDESHRNMVLSVDRKLRAKFTSSEAARDLFATLQGRTI